MVPGALLECSPVFRHLPILFECPNHLCEIPTLASLKTTDKKAPFLSSRLFFFLFLHPTPTPDVLSLAQTHSPGWLRTLYVANNTINF